MGKCDGLANGREISRYNVSDAKRDTRVPENSGIVVIRRMCITFIPSGNAERSSFRWIYDKILSNELELVVSTEIL